MGRLRLRDTTPTIQGCTFRVDQKAFGQAPDWAKKLLKLWPGSELDKVGCYTVTCPVGEMTHIRLTDWREKVSVGSTGLSCAPDELRAFVKVLDEVGL